MRRLLILLLLVAIASADFLTERVDVTVNDIQSDGSAKVHESIKFVMYGNYSLAIYDSGISNNQLSFWSTNTGLKDVKIHINPAKVDIREFRLRPQPRTKCNPIQGICHGELILDYRIFPSAAENSTAHGTGLFTIEKYKPRTERYTIDPAALSFTTTPEGDIILSDKETLTIQLPAGSMTLDVNPQPADTPLAFPSHVDSLSWSDIVLVKLSLVFDVEDSIDKEVSDFFSNIVGNIARTLNSPQGFALVVLVILLIGSYLYIAMAKRKGED